MAEEPRQWRTEVVRVAGCDLTVFKGGVGKPVLILHDELGFPGWMKWNAALAERRTLIIPMHPGYGVTTAPEWIRNIRDIAGLYSILLRQQKLAPIDVIGFSLGGWIAAEMAAANPNQFEHMVLVAPAGIKPSEGEITDFFQLMAPDQLRATVLDPEAAPEFAQLFGGNTPEAFSLMGRSAGADRPARMATVHASIPACRICSESRTGLPTALIWGQARTTSCRSRRRMRLQSVDQRLDTEDFRQVRSSSRGRKRRSLFVAEVQSFLA